MVVVLLCTTTNFSSRITVFYPKDFGLSVRGPSRGEPKLGSWANVRVVRLMVVIDFKASQKQVFHEEGSGLKGGENTHGFWSQQAIWVLHIQVVHDRFFVKGNFRLHQSLPRLRCGPATREGPLHIQRVEGERKVEGCTRCVSQLGGQRPRAFGRFGRASPYVMPI